jgi:hypothetical protein
MAQFTELQVQTALKVGPQVAGDGSLVTGRADKQGNATTVFGHAPLAEAVLRGNVFAITAVAGITTQAGLSVTTPALTLYNPAGSGMNAALIYAGVAFTVVFAAVAAVWLAANTNPLAAAVTGTLTTTHRNLLLGGRNPTAIPLLAATLPAAPVAIDLLGVGITGAVNLLPTNSCLEKWYNGAIILAPGTAISIQTGAASGASGTFCSYIWEEIPIT